MRSSLSQHRDRGPLPVTTRIKICGITSLDDAMCAAEAGADAVGFIFYSGSQRCVSPAEAGRIVERLPPFVTPVGVFVNSPRAEAELIVRDVRLGAVQLHGDERPVDCLGWKVPVIKAFRVGESFDLELLRDYPAAAYLLDTYTKGTYGGTGLTFDWDVAVRAMSWGRVILSGGLSCEVVSEAVDRVRPYAVDVCSGVEVEPGKKDHNKIRTFIRLAKGIS